MKIIRVALFLLLCASAFGQSSSYYGTALSTRGLPLANQNVAVCSQPANTSTTPCSPLATLATSTITISGGVNPLTTDSLGNYHFYAAPGAYTVQIYGPQVSTPLAQVDVIIAPNGIVSVFNRVQYVDASLSRGGVDIGDEINKAYAACPAAPGVCHIILTNQTPLSYTTPITFTTKGKAVELEATFPCIVQSASSTLFGGCLNFTPTGGGSAITLDWLDTAQTNQPGYQGIKNLTLLNNGCVTTGGCGSSTNGIVIGTTNGGCFSCHFEYVSVYGFNVGYLNTNVASASHQWLSPIFQANSTAAWDVGTLQVWASGGLFIGNARAILAASSTTPEIHWTLVSMVNNITFPNVDFTNAGSAGVPGHFYATNSHFENGGTSSSDMQFVGGNVDQYYSGGLMEDDSTAGTGTNFIACSGLEVQFSAVEVSGTNRATTNFLVLNSPCRASGVVGFQASASSKYTAIIGGANAAKSSVLFNQGNTANPAITWTHEQAEAFIEGTAPSGVASSDVCYGDSTLHAMKCSYNNGTFFQIPQVITATSSAFATATTAGTCVNNTTAVTGATTAMAVSISPVSTPGVGAVWSAFVSSAGNVTINECAVATSAGGTIAFNIRVTP